MTAERRRLARTVLGVPTVPPPRAAAIVNDVRAALSRTRVALAPPPVRIVEAALSSLDQAAVVALCELDVPDALTRPMSVAVLAGQLGVDCDQLERLLRFSATRGWVRFDRRGRVRRTRALAFLTREHPGGWRAWIEFARRDEVVGATAALAPAIRSGAEAFAVANGSSFFEWMAANRDASAAFDAAMAAGGRLHALGLAQAIDWRAVTNVCDVGGGDGALLVALTDLAPHLRGTVFDLPHVVEHAAARPNVAFVAGDAFTRVPAGSDVYLLVNVVHDWSDIDACRILRNVAAAMNGDAMLVVVDGERRRRPIDDLTARADLLMLALAPGGRERTPQEVHELATAAGLRHGRSVQLPSVDWAHIYWL